MQSISVLLMTRWVVSSLLRKHSSNYNLDFIYKIVISDVDPKKKNKLQPATQ